MKALETHVYILVIIVNLFISCKKEKDRHPPVITISSPVENQPFHVNEVIPVKGTITDESALTTAAVNLLNEQGEPVMAAMPVPVSGSTAEVNLTYVLNDIHLENGKYQLCFFASDGTNDSYAYQWIYVYGIPRVLKKIMVTTATSTQSNLSVVDSVTLTLIPYQGFSGDHLASVTNSYSQKFFHCGERTGHFTGVDLSNNSVFFDVPIVSNPPAPYFTGLCYANNNCYVGFYNEQIKGYDHTGAIVYNAKLQKGYFPLHISMDNNGQLVTEEQHKITGDKKLVCYYATGAAKQSVSLTQDIVTFCEMDNTRTVLFGNKAGQGSIQLYDRTTNNLQDPYPYTLAAGPILCALKLDADTYLIAHSNGIIYKYVYSSSSVTPYLTGYIALQLAKDDIANVLYVVEKNNINRFEYTGLKSLPIIHSAENIVDISFLYNR